MGVAWESTRSLPQPYSQSLSKYTSKRIGGTVLPSTSVAEVSSKAQDSENLKGDDRYALEMRLQAIEVKMERVLELVTKIENRQLQSSKLIDLLKKMAKVLSAKKRSVITAFGLISILVILEFSHRRYQLSTYLYRKYIQ